MSKRTTTRWRDDGLPVVEAKADLMIFVTPEDVACATPKEPCQCAIAQAVRRSAGTAAEAEIHHGIAYIKAPLEDGTMAWQRFRLSPRTRKRVERFDLTGLADTAGYLLKAPTKTQTLAYRQRQAKKTIKAPGSREIRTKDTVRIDSGIRSGVGKVKTSAVPTP